MQEQRHPWAWTEGSPFPQGASWIEAESSYNFCLYSKWASAVTLDFFDHEDLSKPSLSLALDNLKNKSGPYWHCRIPKAQLGGAAYYAYRVDGPVQGSGLSWTCFDPEKLLLDPYAASVYFPPDFNREAAMRPGSNLGKAPLALISACETTSVFKGDPRIRHDWDTIIYELHVRGFTMDPSSGIDAGRRGSFNALIEKIPYLLELGVTVVELMPVFQFDPQEGNYWGYMPLNFFAPHQAYACSQGHLAHPQRDFRAMVKAFHRAGIEVVIDVVYNHTCEGGQGGPFYSYKGIDNGTYYLISNDPQNRYENFSGAGNTLDCADRQVRKVVLDSLSYWVSEMGVDGFRFDLASVFSRNRDGSLNLDDPQLFSDIVALPELAQVRLIAEPWDTAAYQLGRQLPGIGWAQWNGKFRDDLRRFLRGDRGMVGALMSRLYGSDDLFPDDPENSYRPTKSVNFVTCHDGFTLYDLVAYDQKHNWANGNANIDGTNDNFSWNCGWEGDSGVPADVMELRRRQMKNFCCLLFLSNGTPMLRGGDEFMQTQGGNNNPYNQDRPGSWLDWTRLKANPGHYDFFRKMISFRKSHPSLGRSLFLEGGCALARRGPQSGPLRGFPQPGLPPARILAGG